MRSQLSTLEKLTTVEVRRHKDTFFLAGKAYAEEHVIHSQKRTIAWNIVMRYLYQHHAALIERLEKEGWSNAQLNARIKAVDFVVEGINTVSLQQIA